MKGNKKMGYDRYRTETLERMKEKAWDKYYSETMKDRGRWGDGFRNISKLPALSLSRWEKARQRYYDICNELEKRKRKPQ